MSFLNFFRRWQKSPQITLPNSLQNAFFDFYNHKLPATDNANPHPFETEYAKNFFQSHLHENPTSANQQFSKKIKKFFDSEETFTTISGIDHGKTRNLSEDDKIHHATLLTSTILSQSTQRIRGPNGFYLAFSSNPKVAIDYHIDIINPYKIPKYMALIALDVNSSCPTNLIDNDFVVEELKKHNPKIFEILSTVDFRLKNKSYQERQTIDNIFSIISKPENGKYFICIPDDENRFYLDESRLEKYSKDEVIESLNQFREILKKLPNQQISLSTKDETMPQILIFKNQRLLHARLNKVADEEKRNLVYLPLNPNSGKPSEVPTSSPKISSFLQILTPFQLNK